MNCVFYNNEADKGAGVANIDDSYGWFINCTFAENVATTYGSSVYNDIELDGWVRVINSIMYNDTSPATKRHIYNTTGSIATVAYSDIQESTDSYGDWNGNAGVDGGGNVDCDPEFFMSNVANYSVYGNDELPCTYDDGLVPVALCDVVDSADGYNARAYDIAGTPRVDESDKNNTGASHCNYSDMGAYEFIAPVITETANVVIMCFIDESINRVNGEPDFYWGNISKFESDLRKYNALTCCPDFEVKAGCYVLPKSSDTASCSIYDVLPANPYDVPSNITMQMFKEYGNRRYMETDWFKTIFNSLRGTMVPDYIFIFVDNSGSMETIDLENLEYSTEGFSPFVSWLQSTNGYPDAIMPGTDEKNYYEEEDQFWLKWMGDALLDVFIN